MQRINASINMTKLKKELIAKPELIAFVSKKTGDSYVNVTIWINSDLDDFNNDVSIQLNPPKDVELDHKIYIGNGKTNKAQDEIERRKELAESKLSYEGNKVKNNEQTETDENGDFTPYTPVDNDPLPF